MELLYPRGSASTQGAPVSEGGHVYPRGSCAAEIALTLKSFSTTLESLVLCGEVVSHTDGAPGSCHKVTYPLKPRGPLLVKETPLRLRGACLPKGTLPKALSSIIALNPRGCPVDRDEEFWRKDHQCHQQA